MSAMTPTSPRINRNPATSGVHRRGSSDAGGRDEWQTALIVF